MILAKPTAATVTKFVFDHTGFRPTDVTCPSGVPAKAGGKFQCHFTGPDGKYVAYMQIKSVNGTRVEYDIQSQRVGITINAAGAARTVTTFVAQHTSFHPRDVSCPSGVVPLLGNTLTCHFTGPDGKYTASVTVTSANRGVIGYRIRTFKSG